MYRLNRMTLANLAISLFLILPSLAISADGPRVIEVTATKDAKWKVAGEKEPIIRVKAGEVIRLKITSFKGSMFEKDGTTHSFTVREFADQGWDLRLKTGTEEFTLVVPDKPGEYQIDCAVMCDPKRHFDMTAKLIITP